MNNSQTLLWSMLSEQSTEQLDERLAQELHRETVDEDAVRTILAVLRDREKDERVEVTPEIRQAWEKYQADSKAIQGSKAKGRKVPGWGMRAASIGIVLLLLFAAIPQQAQADNFWERIARWTDSFFEYFNPHAKEAVQEKYEFQSDNIGLQQVYDMLVGLGVTEPVVPMWLPEGYKLTKVIEEELPDYRRVCASFSNDEKEILFEYRVHTTYIPGQYQKDNTEVIQYEFNGTDFNIIQNYEMWIVTWLKNNIECYFTIDCQRDELLLILTSIYELEESA